MNNLTLNLTLILLIASSMPLSAQETVAELESKAKGGDSTAQYLLGVRYSKGDGVPTNKVQAYKWLHLAVMGGNSKAVMARYELSREMSQLEIADAQAEAAATAPAKAPPAAHPRSEEYRPAPKKQIPKPDETSDRKGHAQAVELIRAYIANAESKPSTTRVVIAVDDRGIVRNDAPSVGWKQQMSIETGSGGQLQVSGHNWGIGAEHAFKTTIDDYGTEGFRFDVEGDKDFPLTFKVTEDGYAYLCGRGTLTLHGYPSRKFGYEKTEQDWIVGLRSDHQLIREGSAEAAGWLKLRAAVPQLIQCLSDNAWEVRRNACEALGIIGDFAATDAVQKLTVDANDEVKAVAKESLQRLRSANASTRPAPLL